MIYLISIILNLAMAMLAMAFFTLMERKFLGYFHLRKGPNKVMMMGIPQPFADAIKLFIKQQISPSKSNKLIFFLAPMFSLTLCVMLWMTYPHMNVSKWFQFSILYFLCVSSMNVYALFLTGWASNSKYALLGALRGVAQTISYEISMVLILLGPLYLMLNMEMSLISFTTLMPFIVLIMPYMIMWFSTNLAETNRAPFDFAEGESELVSGFNIEFGSVTFAFIFMAEYANILFMSLITGLMFLQSFMKILNLSIVIMTTIISILFIWVRASYPRMRYDFLMMLAWKAFLPVTLMMSMFLILLNWY
nr:TPA: NADH dehydrogenase subunit 1 [Bdellodrilus illuminatus]